MWKTTFKRSEVHTPSNSLKAVFRKFHLVHSWISWPIYDLLQIIIFFYIVKLLPPSFSMIDVVLLKWMGIRNNILISHKTYIMYTLLCIYYIMYYHESCFMVICLVIEYTFASPVHAISNIGTLANSISSKIVSNALYWFTFSLDHLR